jgi:chromate reductase
VKVFAFCGSLREGSFNARLLALATRELVRLGVEVDTFSLKAANLPMYDEDVLTAGGVKSIDDAKERIAGAHGVLCVSPEYNYSIPGTVKNFVDWCSRPPATNPFKGKLAALMGATPGFGGTAQGQLAIRHVFSTGLSCWVMPGIFALNRAGEAFDDAGALKDEMHARHLESFLARFVEELRFRNR